MAAGERHHLFSQNTIYDFMKEQWQFSCSSKHKQRDLCRLFNDHAQKTNEDHLTIKGGMSDLLGLYGLLRHFVETRVPADRRIAAEVDNFHLVCKAVDLLLAAKKRRVPVRDAGRQLLALLQQHLQKHVEAHGNGRVRPKTHWAFDIAECMQQDEMLLDAFGTERLHLRVKGVAEHCKNIVAYEKSVMSGITNVHLNSLAHRGVSTVAMLGATTCMPGAPDIRVAQKSQCFGDHFNVGDFVFRGAYVGRTVLCASPPPTQNNKVDF